jgi:uncharacterized membrane protein YeaQ/YmgE (transglycosylase-associated protein family)
MTNRHDGFVPSRQTPVQRQFLSPLFRRRLPAGRAQGGRLAKGTTRMGLLSWIVVGAIAGFLANMVMGSREGLLMMIVLGVVGGLVGGFVAASILKIGTVDGINIESIAIATAGAIVIVFLAGMSRGRRGVSQG